MIHAALASACRTARPALGGGVVATHRFRALGEIPITGVDVQHDKPRTHSWSCITATTAFWDRAATEGVVSVGR